MRFSLVAVNLIILLVVLAFVLQKPDTSGGTQPPTANSNAIANTVANPLDQLASADIARTVAQVSNLPETTAVTNQAQSEAADLAMAYTDNNNVISKPQVVATALKSRADIRNYVTRAGDTVSGLAAKFGVTSQSIRWSNSLSAADGLSAGLRLVIPPVNGVVYIVKAGDTPASLAVRFRSNAAQIIAYNDAEIGGLKPGERIIIPNASQATSSALGSSFGLNGFDAVYGYNGYDFGNCTWYVATQIPVPANWGNAATWAYYARQSGWSVSSTPSAGSIAQTSAGYFGHVAVVQSVNSNGTVTISEMNFYGFDIHDVRTAPASEFQNYISR